ncbi:MAG: VOC family protein [Gammaproteobacteria bacterium]|nr:VOC family protein [Gammaproteobacteria bacterium]
MLSHFCLGTNDAGRAARFYDAVLGALGLARCEDRTNKGSRSGAVGGFTGTSPTGRSRFGCAGRSTGAPGLRPHYYPDFYAAYVRDPDGNKLAAVCRGFTRSEER